jgi:lactate dehydrogenase-like 2-hydroxyacid dehydrogenase
MKIALLINQKNMEKYSNKGDLRSSWELIHLGNGDVADSDIIATGAEVVVADAVNPVSAAVINAMPQLKLIHSQGVAYNLIDCQVAKEKGVFVCNNAAVNAGAVAEHAIMLMLVLLRRFTESQIQVRAGKQIDFKNSCFENGLPELYGKRIGIIGLGAIGKELVKRLTPFGCRFCYNDAVPIADSLGAEYVSKEEIFKSCDIISLHAPVLPSTINMINDESLAMFKPGAILINTARGELIDQEALCRALESGSLGGFGADTLSPEPVRLDNPLLKLSPEAEKKVALTPHVAGITAESFMRMYSNIWRNIASVEDGKRPINIVNGL